MVQASTSPLRVEVEHMRKKDFDRKADMLKATNMEVVSTLKDLLTMHPLYNEQLKSFANVGGDFNNPDRLADLAASLTSADEDALQAIMEEVDIPKRCPPF
jgi:ATP-dependent Lon protease